MSSHIYVSGPMRGYAGYNFPAFFHTERFLREVYPLADINNPAREDVVRFNLQHLLAEDETGLLAGQALLDDPEAYKFDLNKALGADLDYICHAADLVVTLPGWQQSKGAVAEVATAVALGIPVVEAADMLRAAVEGAEPITAVPHDFDPAVVAWSEVLNG